MDSDFGSPGYHIPSGVSSVCAVVLSLTHIRTLGNSIAFAASCPSTNPMAERHRQFPIKILWTIHTTNRLQ